MVRYRAALAALLVVAACGGNPFLPEPVDPTPPDPNAPQPSSGQDNAVENLRGFRYDGTTLEIDMAGVSSSGQYGLFRRKAEMDIPAHGPHPAYLAYEFQETNMTRSYLAYVAENDRGTLLSVASADGGQFNEHNGGGGWVRLTGYSRPDIAASPSLEGTEEGTFSYYGAYAGVFVPGFNDPGGPPRPPTLQPGEPLGVRGVIQVNAQFTNRASGDHGDRAREPKERSTFPGDSTVLQPFPRVAPHQRSERAPEAEGKDHIDHRLRRHLVEAIGEGEDSGREEGNPFLMKISLDGLAEAGNSKRHKPTQQEDTDGRDVRGEPYRKLTHLSEKGADAGADPVKEWWF
jgi:hypothetical protein